MNLNSGAGIALLAATLAMFSGCSNVSVTNRSKPASHLSQYRLYDWEPSSVDPGNPAVRDAIASELDQRRIEPVLSGRNPDFLIAYKARIIRQPSFGGVRNDPSSRQIASGPSRARFQRDEASIEIDFLDAGTHRIFWSGNGTAVVDQNALSPIAVNRMVKRILARYPAPPAGSEHSAVHIQGGAAADLKASVADVSEHAHDSFKKLGVHSVTSSATNPWYEQTLRGKRGDVNIQVKLKQASSSEVHVEVTAKQGTRSRRDVAENVLSEILRAG